MAVLILAQQLLNPRIVHVEAAWTGGALRRLGRQSARIEIAQLVFHDELQVRRAPARLPEASREILQKLDGFGLVALGRSDPCLVVDAEIFEIVDLDRLHGLVAGERVVEMLASMLLVGACEKLVGEALTFDGAAPDRPVGLGQGRGLDVGVSTKGALRVAGVQQERGLGQASQDGRPGSGELGLDGAVLREGRVMPLGGRGKGGVEVPGRRVVVGALGLR